MPVYQRNITLENEIVTRLHRGDRQAIALLYQNYSGALFGIISRIVPIKEVAEEILQDVFVKIWDNADKYDSSKGRLFTWLAQITRNAALDTVRSARYKKGQKTGELDNSVYNDESLTANIEIRDPGLKKVIESLDEKYRTLIEYAYFKGYSQSEIAEELDMPIGTVKTRVRTAVSELRTLLQNEVISLLLMLSLWGV